MSDATITSIVTASVTIATMAIGWLTLWLKLRYGNKKLDENTEATQKIEVQTNGDLGTKLAMLADHEARVSGVEAKIETLKTSLDAMQKNIDSTRHELRGHLQTITNSLQVMSILRANAGVGTAKEEKAS